MARQRNAPDSGRRRSSIMATPARNQGMKIPLNDDSAEKAKRQAQRNLIQEQQKQKMMAAASPGPNRSAGGTAANSPRTPRNVGGAAGRPDALDAVTPLKRLPILANFEEMMKMATDNKINATNSWNFALIDYFHDMSLLKEGDGVNFQKASCTLDGCVKIYTSRVDSVATETGKLLSGLADSTGKKGGRDDEDEDGSDAEAGEDGEAPRRARKKTQRSAESTLAKDFSQLQIKKFELEFSVDPLFKKASADFDEGGAKGLLLNHLSIDANGRIVFDSSDDSTEAAEPAEPALVEDRDASEAPESTQPAATQAHQHQYPPSSNDVQDPKEIASLLSNLQSRYFPDLSHLDSLDVCPTLKNYDLDSGDPNAANIEIPHLNNFMEGNNDEPEAPRADMAYGFDDGYGLVDGDGDDDMSVAFGEGGDVWANETIADAADRMLSPSKRLLGLPGPDDDPEAAGESNAAFTVGFGAANHEDILSYFDEALRKNWAGPEHWRIRRIKEISKQPATARQRKEKEPFEIDFMNPSGGPDPSDLAPPKSLTTISLPKKDRVSKNRHLLPDDRHFNSRQLLRLFLKPKATLFRRRSPTDNNTSSNQNPEDLQPHDVDEAFWASANMAQDLQATSTPARPQPGTYDANFFADDDGPILPGLGMDSDDDDDIFADAPEMPLIDDADLASAPTTAPLPSSQFPNSTQGGGILGFGSQLVTQTRRVRPEYVQYARVAKKVDVRKLKENIWDAISFEPPSVVIPAVPATATTPAKPAQVVKEKGEEDKWGVDETTGEPVERKFTEVVNDLRKAYPEKTMDEISTSYCFICLLHLANERGLEIKEQPIGEEGRLEELVIKRDLGATVGGEDY